MVTPQFNLLTEGVFIRGKVKAGEVVAFYLGTVYQPADMSLMCDLVFSNNQYPAYFEHADLQLP